MKELFDDLNDTTLTYFNAKHLKNRLPERYGSNIFLTDTHRKETLMCCKTIVYSILNISW